MKKRMASLLALAMVLSLDVVGAFADEGVDYASSRHSQRRRRRFT